MPTDCPHLICSIGAGEYSEATYCLDGGVCATRFAPVALAHLRKLQGGKASILVTPKARREWYEILAAELREAGLAPEPVEVPEGRTREEFLRTIHCLVDSVRRGETVVLDVTFALRHLPFVYLAALTYLTAYREVNIQGIYYGAFHLKHPETGEAPILDLTGLFGLTQWYHAVQSVRESGDLRPIARLLEEDVARIFRQGATCEDLSRAKNAVKRLAPALSAGLPLEIGLEAREVAARLRRLREGDARNELAALSLKTLEEFLEQWSLPAEASSKKNVVLSTEELRRELALASWFAERGDVPKTLLLLREWLVSWLLLHRDQLNRWLDRNSRRPVEEYLNGLARRARHRVATAAEEKVAALWQQVADVRNSYAHVGMRAEVNLASQSVVNEILEQCRLLLERGVGLQISGPPSRTVLATPLGLSPGVLYSAARHIRPDGFLVITSVQGRQSILEALTTADVTAKTVLVRELADPMTGFQEAGALIDDEVRRYLVEAGDVVVNLTGGTTVIQYVVERVANEARELGVPVRRVAVVDRRSPEEQRADPYVLGELVELDGVRAEKEDQEDGLTG